MRTRIPVNSNAHHVESRNTARILTRFKVHQRPPSPVNADEREETVLDLVPLAGAGWVVADGDRKRDLITQLLQTNLPCPESRTIAATIVRADQKALRSRIRGASIHFPPAADALDRELGRVVADANIDDRAITAEVVRPVRDPLAFAQVGEVVGVHLLGATLLSVRVAFCSRRLDSIVP